MKYLAILVLILGILGKTNYSFMLKNNENEIIKVSYTIKTPKKTIGPKDLSSIEANDLKKEKIKIPKKFESLTFNGWTRESSRKLVPFVLEANEINKKSPSLVNLKACGSLSQIGAPLANFDEFIKILLNKNINEALIDTSKNIIEKDNTPPELGNVLIYNKETNSYVRRFPLEENLYEVSEDPVNSRTFQIHRLVEVDKEIEFEAKDPFSIFSITGGLSKGNYLEVYVDMYNRHQAELKPYNARNMLTKSTKYDLIEGYLNKHGHEKHELHLVTKAIKYDSLIIKSCTYHSISNSAEIDINFKYYMRGGAIFRSNRNFSTLYNQKNVRVRGIRENITDDISFPQRNNKFIKFIYFLFH